MTAAGDPAGTITVDVDDVRSPTDSPDVTIDQERWADLARSVLEAEGVFGDAIGASFRQ